MNLTANTGPAALSGAPFLMLPTTVSNFEQEANRRMLSYQAYAPDPMVFETILNGNCTGNGASCECGISRPIANMPRCSSYCIPRQSRHPQRLLSPSSPAVRSSSQLNIHDQPTNSTRPIAKIERRSLIDWVLARLGSRSNRDKAVIAYSSKHAACG